MDTLFEVDYRKPFFVLAVVVAVMLIILGIILHNMHALHIANEELSTELVTLSKKTCAARVLGEISWYMLDPGGRPVCLRFRTPPERKQWQIYYQYYELYK